MTAVLVIGDSYMPASAMQAALNGIGPDVSVRLADVDPNQRPPLDGVHEYQGDPETFQDGSTARRSSSSTPRQ